MKLVSLAIVGFISLCNVSVGGRQPPSSIPTPGRWEAEIRAFERSDEQSPPPKGAVLFIGSSSIRMWTDLEKDFPKTKVLNRGFGGSEIDDSTALADRIVFPYEPRMIVLYAGDNDLAAGKTPEQVFDEYKQFVDTVRRRLPKTPIAFISIKPSPSRWHLVKEMKAANDLIRRYTKRNRKLTYIDVFTPMLTPEGTPRPELYLADHLHMTRAGYDIWRTVIAPYLKESRR